MSPRKQSRSWMSRCLRMGASFGWQAWALYDPIGIVSPNGRKGRGADIYQPRVSVGRNADIQGNFHLGRAGGLPRRGAGLGRLCVLGLPVVYPDVPCWRSRYAQRHRGAAGEPSGIRCRVWPLGVSGGLVSRVSFRATSEDRVLTSAQGGKATPEVHLAWVGRRSAGAEETGA